LATLRATSKGSLRAAEIEQLRAASTLQHARYGPGFFTRLKPIFKSSSTANFGDDVATMYKTFFEYLSLSL